MAECENGSEATGLPGAQQPCYDDVIQRKIRPIFENYINPNNVLTIFWKYDQNVLVKRDIELVQAMTLNIGITAGAGKLLELLCKYENWVPCLIQVLKDEEVNQKNVARMILYAMEMIKSDKSVDINLKVLTEKDILIEGLRTELEESKRKLEHEIAEHARKEKEMLEQKVLAEKMMLQQKIQAGKDKRDQEQIIQKLKAELKEMLGQKVQAEKNRQDQSKLIQELKTELEEIKRNLNKEIKRHFSAETLVCELLRNTPDISMMGSLMLQFAECGQYIAMTNLIENGVDVNLVNSDGKTSLMFAAGDGNLKYVNWLLVHGADINLLDKTKRTALSHAAVHGRLDCVRALLDAGKNKHVNNSDINGQTPLMLAARSGGDNVLCLLKLLNAGADLDSKDKFGYTVLLHAVSGGNVKCVQVLLQVGSHKHVNFSSNDGQTPLMLAAKCEGDNVLCLEKILDAGADISLKNKKGYTALAYAALSGNANCLETLLESGGLTLVNVSNDSGETPLMLAARSEGDNVLCLEKLLKAGADVDMKDKLNYTSLSYAVEYKNVNCVQTLLEVGSHKYVNISNRHGLTPLMEVAGFKGDNVLCLQKLLKAGSDINIRNTKGYTALAFAAEAGNVKCVQALLEAGGHALVNVSNIFGQTPLMLVSRSKGDNILCLQKLLDAHADIYIQDSNGRKALTYATAAGNFRCMQALCDASSFNNTKDNST